MIVIHEWWGLDNHIKDVTTRFAREGYVALASDLFRGAVTDNANEAMRLAQGLPQDRPVKDLDAAIRSLKSQDFVRGEKIGIIGYCMGGGLSLRMACHSRELAAAVVYYGCNPSPIDQIQMITCPVLGIYGEADPWISPAVVHELEEALKKYGKTFEAKIYPGAPHAFFNDEREDYRADAAQDAWARTLAFYEKYLKSM